MSWLDKYNAAKGGRPAPPPAPAPQQPYAPPSTQYYPPQQGPQPIPGAPPHAPFGYDQRTGTPLAPYGYYQDGRVAYPPPPQQYAAPQPPAYQPNGLPQPQGYDPAFNGPQQPYQGQPGGPPVEYDDQGQAVVHAMDAVANFKGGEGNKSAGACPECGGTNLFPRTAGNQGRKLNTNTGQFVDPAPECSDCGYNGIFTQMGSAGGAGSAAGVKVTGKPRLAPGAGTAQQVAAQHGLPNLFAPK